MKPLLSGMFCLFLALAAAPLSAAASPMFFYPNPPGCGGLSHTMDSRSRHHHQNLVRASGRDRSGLQSAQTGASVPRPLSPTILQALRAIYRSSEFDGMTPDQVKSTETANCIANHPLPGQARKKNEYQSPSPQQPETANPPAPVAFPPSPMPYQEGGANGSL